MNFKHLLFSFEGRIGRQSYWIGILVVTGISIVAGLIGEALGDAGHVLSTLVTFALFYPIFAIAAKRWHDRSKSGWWSVVALVPVAGPLWMLVENGFLRGTPGLNRFGPPPESPMPLEHEGQTYHRHADGGFTHASGTPVTDAALVGALGATALALQAEASSHSGGAGGGDGGGWSSDGGGSSGGD